MTLSNIKQAIGREALNVLDTVNNHPNLSNGLNLALSGYIAMTYGGEGVLNIATFGMETYFMNKVINLLSYAGAKEMAVPGSFQQAYNLVQQFLQQQNAPPPAAMEAG